MTSNLTDKGLRDLKLIKRALDQGDTTAYNELMKYTEILYILCYLKSW
ncbi:MAG: hypothetical protein CM15mP112_06990 [Flavobacteriales bacterium]|nr:MAG: hypothetical protein CM15mP112_06990 [Flavobacteriales bacterium]